MEAIGGMIRLGGHLSAKEGLSHVVLAARALGYDAVQIMLGGQHDWKPYNVEASAINAFRNLTVGMDVYVHLPYIMNPCAEGRLRTIGIATYKKYEVLATALSARAMVIHPGFKKELAERDAYRNGVGFVENLLKDARLQILIETDSGSKNGSAVGSMEFIERMIRDLGDEKVGMCLDTCHVYGRGVDLWEPEVLKGVVGKYGKRIRLVHLNVPDSDVELGSHRDRHNSSFETYPRSSELLVKTLSMWTMIMERRSIAVQKDDAKYVRKVLQVEVVPTICIPQIEEV